jgi:gluconate 2-dehydrogenase gamma chain
MSDELEPMMPADAQSDGTAAREGSVAKPVSRRAALKVLGSVPIAGAMMGSSAFAQQGTASGAKQTHQAPVPPTQGQATPPQPAKRAFFTAAEWRTVSVLADDIIPADGRSGSATQAGVPAFIDYHLSVPEASEDSKLAIRGGLAWLNTESRKRFRRNYATLSQAQRNQILDDISWPRRAKPEFSHGTAFFSRMRDLVGMGFFSSAMGWKDLRYEGNVFNPDWQGCPEAAMQKLGVSHALMDTRIKVE